MPIFASQPHLFDMDEGAKYHDLGCMCIVQSGHHASAQGLISAFRIKKIIYHIPFSGIRNDVRSSFSHRPGLWNARR